MSKHDFLSREWVEIVRVLEDATLIDSNCNQHIFNEPTSLAPGFYLAVHPSHLREFSRADLVGPMAQRSMVEMLYESALHMGAGAEPHAPATGSLSSVLPFIRQQAEAQMGGPI